MENQPVIVERLINAPVSKVWKAITDRDQMKSWYFDLIEFIPRAGFRFEFSGGPSPEKQYLHLCEITDVVQEKKLTYSWKYKGFTGISYVNFELSEQENQTLLRLTHSGIETFPEDNPDFDKSNFRIGWDHIINKSLVEFLEK